MRILFLSLLKAFRPKVSKVVLLRTILTSFEVSLPGLLMLLRSVIGTRVLLLQPKKHPVEVSDWSWLEFCNKVRKVTRTTVWSFVTGLLDYFGKGWLLCKILCLDVPYC